MPPVTGWTRLVGALAAAYLGGGTALAQPPSHDSYDVAVRAAYPLSDEQLKAFAVVVQPLKFTHDAYPDLPRLTPRQVVVTLCGSFRQAYWQQLLAANSATMRVADPDTVMGDSAYSVLWPGCPYVQVNPKAGHVVQVGETASDIYAKLTGSTGTPSSWARFFAPTGAINLSKLKPGQVLQTTHQSAPGVFSSNLLTSKLSMNFADVQPQISDSAWRALLAMSTPDPGTQLVDAPTFSLFAGRIAAAGGGGPGDYQPPQECRSAQPGVPAPAPLAPFDAERVSIAWHDAHEALVLRHQRTTSVEVTIADNGFFGARRQPDGHVAFGPRFPERFFPVVSADTPGQIGPVTMGPDGGAVYPINSWAHPERTATVVSGHGTHVAGLALGGVTFKDSLALFNDPDGEPWLQFWIINVGDGQATLLPNSANELSRQLNLRKGNIINLSIQYTGNASISGGNVLRLDDGPTDNLFVVAAGNAGPAAVTEGPYYPAVQGGNAQGNVLTVAAHRPDGTLADFSNRGRYNVDLAAPGCDVESWLDDSDRSTPVSGTSQSAAIATFAAVLVKSLGGLAPREIKNRLIASGDLLTSARADGSGRSDPGQVYSRSRLNVVRALYLFDDYLRYHDDTGVHEVLGVQQGMTGMTCDGTVDARTLWAAKRGDDGLWIYRGRLLPDHLVEAPCLATVAPTAALHFYVRAELDAKGQAVPSPDHRVLQMPISQMEHFVGASRPYRAPL